MWARCFCTALADVVTHRDERAWTDLLVLTESARGRGGHEGIETRTAVRSGSAAFGFLQCAHPFVLACHPLSPMRILVFLPWVSARVCSLVQEGALAAGSTGKVFFRKRSLSRLARSGPCLLWLLPQWTPTRFSRPSGSSRQLPVLGRLPSPESCQRSPSPCVGGHHVMYCLTKLHPDGLRQVRVDWLWQFQAARGLARVVHQGACLARSHRQVWRRSFSAS